VIADPLSVRLFGYGVPYRVRFGDDGAVDPLPTDAASEAARLARELGSLSGEAGAAPEEDDVWALSMPFGRCGLDGLPLEHLIVYHQQEAYLETLSPAGLEVQGLQPGQIVLLEPGRVVRVRARPRPGRNVLVAFQTEDQTPLLGNAAPLTLDGQVPEEYSQRLRHCHAAFDELRRQAVADMAGYAARLDAFLGGMAARVQNDAHMREIQDAARAAGSYDVADQAPLFARQRDLLTPDVLGRIAAADELLFRFPGMFGGITTLFKLLQPG
jgi:hypothetical protein